MDYKLINKKNYINIIGMLSCIFVIRNQNLIVNNNKLPPLKNFNLIYNDERNN